MPEGLQRQHCEAGTVIFREGQAGDCAYVVESGKVEISALRHGSSVVLTHLRQGALFGEMALIDGALRSATARALAATTLIVIDREQVDRKVSAAEPLIRLFLKVILDRLRATTSMLAPDTADTLRLRLSELDYEKERSRALAVLEVEERLKRGVEREEFQIVYQPIVRLEDGIAAGFEALVRWRTPEGEVVSPSEFIGLAEETGLIVPLGLQVLAVACAELPVLQAVFAQHFPAARPLFMSVNLSARQIAEPGIVAAVMSATHYAQADPTRLKLEVTESSLMVDPDRAVTVLNQFRGEGFAISIDDFGTGYSSLSYLQRFPIEALKIDQSFVRSMLVDAADEKIVRAVTRLGKELGLAIVAEGVESREELAALARLGCDFGQGFLFSRPVDLDEAARVVCQKFT
jgi:EAL domain-containing protein (putative c-di-GMP-specific phosphodiesterase class I)